MVMLKVTTLTYGLVHLNSVSIFNPSITLPPPINPCGLQGNLYFRVLAIYLVS